jgi:tRNA G18 (ribose-2'-O)-methylase SpoU
VPFARVEQWPGGLEVLRAAGFAIVALTPARDAREIGAFAADSGRPGRVALLVGNEGEGLSAAAESMADARVRIPMAPGVDSLNLATATGIALQRLREHQPLE